MPFYETIQKKREAAELLHDLKSMAWDVRHVRHLEEMMTVKRVKGARYFIPAILTFDKRYIEIFEAQPLQSMAFKDGTRIVRNFFAGRPFGPNTEEFEAELFAEFYNSDRRSKRVQNPIELSKYELSALVGRLESEFLRVTMALNPN